MFLKTSSKRFVTLGVIDCKLKFMKNLNQIKTKGGRGYKS